MQAAVDARGCRLRPHAKTHKSPDLARVQIDRGAVGICCAKLGEAEVFADAGIPDIRLPYPLNPANADRVLALLDRTHLSFIVDHADVARGWSDALTAAGRDGGRAGQGGRRVPSLRDRSGSAGRRRLRGARRGAAGPALPRAAQPRRPRLWRGVRERNGGVAEAEARDAEHAGGAGQRIAASRVDEISVGATPTARFSVQQDGITELRPGQLHLLRSHAGRARRGDVGRLRADGARARRQQAGARSRDPRQRQQDADERPGARACR